VMADERDYQKQPRRRYEVQPDAIGPSTTPRQRYDVEMIRDFLEHLVSQIRSRCDYSNHTGNWPEALQQTKAYEDKYGTSLLTTGIGLDDSQVALDDLTDEQVKQIGLRLFAIEGERYLEYLQHLEGLQSLFEEVFFCLSQFGRVHALVSIADLLDNAEPDR
jgi:hypothetical protein